MRLPSKETVEMLRRQYPAGTLVELIEMKDPYSQLRPGDRGRVVWVDDAAGIHVAWSNGEGLAAIWGEDFIRKVPDQATDEGALE